MKTLVTGSAGLLGSNLVNLLIKQGRQVQTLVCSKKKAQQLLGDLLGVKFAVGDMENVPSFAHNWSSCD